MYKYNKSEILENGVIQLVPYHKCSDYYVTIYGDVYSKKSGGLKNSNHQMLRREIKLNKKDK